VLAAQQSPENPDWFQGTADAVRQYLWLFKVGGFFCAARGAAWLLACLEREGREGLTQPRRNPCASVRNPLARPARTPALPCPALPCGAVVFAGMLPPRPARTP
jgi:hypothetical protein